MTKTAIVLFNLGGPDKTGSIQPFLFNLFNDKAIIGVPQPFRWMLAKIISTRRAPVAAEIYEHLGGKSPLLELTGEQADALENALNDGSDEAQEFKCFISMRYWHPMSAQAVSEVKAWDPDNILLLPLYPQFSTTTTGSSLEDWHKRAAASRLEKPTQAVCCYPTDGGWVSAVATSIHRKLAEVPEGEPVRILFSAHGLPKKVVEKGDPYQMQVEQTSAAVVEKLAIEGLDWIVCYQSRVGPLEWIGPSTEDELARAGTDKTNVLVVPVAFVSEHSETLVELDIEYRELAEELGIPGYFRAPAVATDPEYISGLAGLVRKALGDDAKPLCNYEPALCPHKHVGCPHQSGA